MVVQVFFEIRGGDALESEMVEVGPQELVESFATEGPLEREQEEGSFFVSDARHAVVGVAAVQVDVQDLVFCGKLLELVAKLRQAEDSLHVRARDAVDVFDDSTLKIGSKPFVEPEVPPGCVGDEVARPRVGQLMRDQ